MENSKGLVTIPTDLDVVPETLELMKRWGADAIRDCDGTDFPEALKDADAEIYSTYYTTRKDNEWAKANPEEIQQMYLMTPFYTADSESLSIEIMKGLYPDMLSPNTRDDIKRWWEVVDRTTGKVVPTDEWDYNEEEGKVTIKAVPFHEYTVSFLAYIMWDPVHMYNAVTNDWKDVEHQITFDVRQPKTHEYTLKRLRKFIEDHPYVNVLRFTTFFHQFTLVFDELAREKYVDWYGYSASVSPYILKQFEEEVGYPFRAEYIIDQGYYNNQYRVPSKEFQDFQAFQRREVAKIVKEMTEITHECGKKAMMFLGDHWIGTEPFMEEFKTLGIDAVVGSVGNGSTLRLISDIEGVKYTEGRLLPYFFPDVFNENGDPVKEAKYNWVTARRAILRKPIDRIGYGGYLKLALQFPEFLDYVENEYEVKLSNRAKSSFYKNKERDLAIIALLLASGVRLSEAVNLDLKDINLKMMVIDVTRKGGKRDSVNVASFAKPYLETYLSIRDKRYKAEKQDVALFLTEYRGVPNRIDASSIEKMVAKYSQDFKIRVTPHKLRHTLATRLYDATKSQVLVSHQLGHASTQVTDLYTHIVNDEQKNALDSL